MCRLRVVVALVLVAAASLGAQSRRSGTVRAQSATLDSVMARVDRARKQLEAYDDSIGHSRRLLDTVRAGALRVLVARPYRDRVARAAPGAFAYADSVAGSASARVAKQWITVRPMSNTSADRPTDTLRLFAVTPAREWPDTWGNPADTTLAKWMGRLAVRLIAEDLRREFTSWMPHEMTPDTVQATTWAAARLDLVSTPTTITRACYSGDIGACKIALRLAPPNGNPATDWMDANGRRWFFARGPGRQFGLHDSRVEASPCVAGDDAACRRLLASVDFEDWHVSNWFPTTPLVRSTLARLAVQLGGRDAYERLIAASGKGPNEAIAVAAGMPLDSVVSQWQRRVRDTRLPSQDISFVIAGSSIAWILVCGALSLRSSRWR